MIFDNILVAFEIFHDMNIRLRVDGDMALKLDMAKAFDIVEWNFLRALMLKLGLWPEWVGLVMHYVESTTFSFIVNGELKGFVKPRRGIRQWGPHFSLSLPLPRRGPLISSPRYNFV